MLLVLISKTIRPHWEFEYSAIKVQKSSHLTSGQQQALKLSLIVHVTASWKMLHAPTASCQSITVHIHTKTISILHFYWLYHHFVDDIYSSIIPSSLLLSCRSPFCRSLLLFSTWFVILLCLTFLLLLLFAIARFDFIVSLHVSSLKACA